jgi:hypothetical protein
MTRIHHLAVLVPLLLASDARAQDPLCDASAVWERMLKAKGGRAQLGAINAILISHEDRRSGRLITRSLAILPTFVWGLLDNGDPRLGRIVSHTYLDRGFSLEWQSETVADAVRRRPLPEKPYPFFEHPALFFETRWMKPSSLKCHVANGVTIVEGTFFDTSYEFHLAQGRDLPTKIVVQQPGNAKAGIIELREYERHLSGLMLPTIYEYSYGLLQPGPHRVRYEINPSYDPKLPDLSPAETNSPEGWRVKR